MNFLTDPLTRGTTRNDTDQSKCSTTVLPGY